MLEIGLSMIEIFEKYDHNTSILDDFEYYETQEKLKKRNKQNV